MKIEILCTGDEILSGKTINSNYSYMARRLTETGYNVHWGTTVGDDRVSLAKAFEQASKRADAVIVNGGLGPTIDDLSQEMAAQAAGVELVLHQEWLNRIGAWYHARNRKMPSNNQKQAMLPEGAEFIDNPIGTACGFALDIEETRFFFTPGVPNELQRMLEEQVLSRLQKIRGIDIVTQVKRFHTFGIGESRADQMLDDVEEIFADKSVKLGFQSHYPQLETKLTASAGNAVELERKLAPAVSTVRQRLGNFVVAEDDNTLEGMVVEALREKQGSISILETDTGGKITTRLLNATNGTPIIKRGIVALDMAELELMLGLEDNEDRVVSIELAARYAESLKSISGSSHCLAVLVEHVQRDNHAENAGNVFIAITDGTQTACRTSTLPGSRRWISLGATELGLDCLRRFLYGLPVSEIIDFEQH